MGCNLWPYLIVLKVNLDDRPVLSKSSEELGKALLTRSSEVIPLQTDAPECDARADDPREGTDAFSTNGVTP